MGESRAEYVARKMSEERRARETAAQFAQFTDTARRHANAEILVALDQEPWGIRRLHRLVPELPSIDAATDPMELERAAFELGVAARGLGVNVFLSPVLDRLEGENAWLQGRTLALSPEDIGGLAAAFVSGIQRAGVAAVAKHFPGFPTVTADPALEVAEVPAGRWPASALEPFRACVDAGVQAVMVGPAPVRDVDPVEPASTSPAAVALLREALGFEGVIVSDDLDAPATLNGRNAPATAVAAIHAGVDLLLVPEGEHLGEIVDALVAAAERDSSFAARLGAAAGRVRALADDLKQ
jgi:beta-N-acetylhexosaminidase